MSDADRKKLKTKTLGAIRRWMDIGLHNHVAKETAPHILSKNLENMYETKNTQAKNFLMRKVTNLKVKEGQPIAKHLNVLKGMASQYQLQAFLLIMTQACLLLSSLPDRWNTLAVSLGNLALE